MNNELKEQWESIKEIFKLRKELKKKLKAVKFNNENAKQLIKIYSDIIKSIERLS